MDGSFTRDGRGGCGGVVRGDNGEWIKGFSVKLEEPLQIATEITAIVEGLNPCWDLKFSKVIVECDDKGVVDAIHNKLPIHGCHDLWEQIMELLSREWTVCIDHTFHESNESANKLAAVSIKQKERRRLWHQPPSSVELILFRDVMGYFTPRRVIS